MQKLTTCVIICTRNRIADIVPCLESLVVQTVLPEQIIIVDSSDRPLPEYDAFNTIFNEQRFSSVQLNYIHTSPGLTYQRNKGIELCQSDIVHFLDDDVVLTSHYIASMREVFEDNHAYAGGMGTITNIPVPARFNWHRLLRYIFLLQRDYASGNFTLSGMPTHAYGTQKLKNVQVLGGCCMAYRSWVFKEYRFDENLKRYGFMEDCDFSGRVSFAYPLFYNPAARLAHNPSISNRDGIIDNRAMYIRNYRYLFFKNIYQRNRLKIIAFWWSIIGLFVEALLTRNVPHLKGYWQGLRKPMILPDTHSLVQRTE